MEGWERWEQGAATPRRGWLPLAGLRHTFGSGLSTINLSSGLGKAVTHGCGHQMFISPLGVPVQRYQGSWDLVSQGADGRRSWVRGCRAGCANLPCLCQDPHLAAAPWSGSANVPKALELTLPALTRRVVLKQFSLGSLRLVKLGA